jgi:hypothetical protein
MRRALALALLLPALAGAAPAFERASLRFFEQADGPILPVARRLYTARFDATRTRRLGVELAATYAAPAADESLPVACTLRQPDGKTLPGERPMDFRFFAGETASNSANLLWGVIDGGDWPAGRYEVECRAGGEPLAKAAIEIVRNPPEVADGDIRVRALRIFPVVQDLPPIASRSYATILAAGETRRIGVELEFSHAPLGRAARIPVDCWFFWPDGQTSPPLELNYEPQADWAGGYSAGAMGFPEPGRWAKGVYTVSCAMGGQPAAVDRFEVR